MRKSSNFKEGEIFTSFRKTRKPLQHKAFSDFFLKIKHPLVEGESKNSIKGK